MILGIDVDTVTILTAIMAIETLVIIVLTIRLLRKSGSGIDPVTADLMKETVKKISNPLDLRLPLAREKLYNFIAILVLYILFPLLIYSLRVYTL